jgi:hypothetical protein
MEYSIEAAALFNPSIVEDPDWRGAGVDQKRVIVTFRARANTIFLLSCLSKAY